MARHRSSPFGAARGLLAPLVVAVTLALVAGAASRSSAQSQEPPPPTPVPGPGGESSPSPFPSALHTPDPSSEPPELRAASALLIDLETGRTLFALDPAEKRPIASLTKIMTAYLVLVRADLTEVVTVGENAVSEQAVGISGLGLEVGERLRVETLLYALLLQSANDVGVALAEHVAGSEEAFVKQMERVGARLGLDRTHFASPTGLDNSGYSTARDLARLTRAAYRVPGFAEIVSAPTRVIPNPAGDPRIVQNRNALLWLYPGAIGVKTGFTTPAGFCLVAAAERDDERLLAVVLGEPGEPFSDAAALLDYGFAAFERRTLIEEGTPLGTVEVAGRDVTVAAGASLEGLVPVAAGIEREIRVGAGVRYPPGPGRAIGTVELSVPGVELGQVPLVVTAVPPPPPLDDGGPWWARAIGAVVDAGAGLLDALLSA